MQNIFSPEVSNYVIERINNLQPKSQPQWGKMSVSQMLAHCNITYEMIYDNVHTKPKGFKKFLITLFVKPIVVNEKPYKKNSRTAGEFIISNSREFETEKARLIEYILKTSQLGELHFDERESHSFGRLSTKEWSNMMYKHLDHHLTQFGV